ncbi:MAG: DUF6754 domain-containing protein [bacterium]
MQRGSWYFVVSSLLFTGIVLLTTSSASSSILTANDTPYDWGKSLTVRWQARGEIDSSFHYEIWRKSLSPLELPIVPTISDSALLEIFLSQERWVKVAEPDPNDTIYIDSDLSADSSYSYLLALYRDGAASVEAITPPVSPIKQYFDSRRTNIFFAVVILVLVLVILVQKAKRGSKLFIRRIAGLEAIEEAVGRATEMGRPVLYIPGLDPMDEVATVAAIDILGQVAKKAAEYSIRLVVPNRDPIVMTVAQQVVRESYTAVGKPHLFREQDIFYVTFSQFGFAAAIAGLMMRERPATNFFIGHFYAESLVLAETGNATGAIQIAGTDADAQLPFFITSCDYTLIGEELYAGSVYLSRQPLMLGALKAQDYAKAVVIGAAIVTTLMYLFNPALAQIIRNLFG